MAEIVRERIFQHFLEFPEEVRTVVINEMEPDDRCRFTRCSKLFQKEAQRCKNYIYGIIFYVSSHYNINFSVIYNKNHINNTRGGYNVKFVSGYAGNKYMIYSNRYGLELWRTQLDRSINMIEYACENVKNMLNLYQKTIKKLCIWTTENYDFEIRSLKNLENLTLGENTDIQQIMSKIRKPLKEFECYPSISERFTREFQQIYEVQNLLNLYRTRLNYEQFQKLSAQQININIGLLTEENVADFIQSWQNDKLRNNFLSCQWNIGRTNFNMQKLFRLLRINQNIDRTQRRTTIDIRHNTDAAKKAELGFGWLRLEFRVLNQ